MKGDLAIVGPRPGAARIRASHRGVHPRSTAERYVVRPGMTGWAQVHLDRLPEFEDTFAKLEYDLYYIKHKSFGLDTLVLLHTLKSMLMLVYPPAAPLEQRRSSGHSPIRQGPGGLPPRLSGANLANMKAVILLLAASVALADSSTPGVQSDLRVQAPAVSRKVSPQYTQQARAAGIEGTVLVYIEIGTDGRAHHARVIRGLGFGLDNQAIECLRHWRISTRHERRNARPPAPPPLK